MIQDTQQNYITSTHEVKYQYVDRMLNYILKSLEPTIQGHKHERLVFDSILSINPIHEVSQSHVRSLIGSSQMRLAVGDYYNARLLMENAIGIMIKGDYDRKTNV
jgi:hypothetical protein